MKGFIKKHKENVRFFNGSIAWKCDFLLYFHTKNVRSEDHL